MAEDQIVALQATEQTHALALAFLLGGLEVAAFGKNLGDEDYFHNIVQFTSTSDARRDPFNIGNALGYPAPGRQWGVELLYRFGK